MWEFIRNHWKAFLAITLALLLATAAVVAAVFFPPLILAIAGVTILGATPLAFLGTLSLPAATAVIGAATFAAATGLTTAVISVAEASVSVFNWLKRRFFSSSPEGSYNPLAGETPPEIADSKDKFKDDDQLPPPYINPNSINPKKYESSSESSEDEIDFSPKNDKQPDSKKLSSESKDEIQSEDEIGPSTGNDKQASSITTTPVLQDFEPEKPEDKLPGSKKEQQTPVEESKDDSHKSMIEAFSNSTTRSRRNSLPEKPAHFDSPLIRSRTNSLTEESKNKEILAKLLDESTTPSASPTNN
ncbi:MULTISPECIES: hypothetical protein [unclassified Legionella]|uniref:hypothetical protein n=1 Tax=unclassified Legionella TaxID=2622702 RepID=UPI001055C69F|nr:MULTISPECIES: hypothetical protein [unclassified Legionella]MDI9819525.1 hypothetical protein [Legionella sp. PL877]